MARVAFLSILYLLLLSSQYALPASTAVTLQEKSLIERIEWATDWVAEQSRIYRDDKVAFASETADFSGRLSTEVNARVAWMFQNHLQHLTSRKHVQNLKDAIDFLLSSQADTQDFHEYYDVNSKLWKNSGRLHYWNAHVAALMALSAIQMRRLPEFTIKHEYWRETINQIQSFVETWTGIGLRNDGAWMFVYPNWVGPGIAENGMMLAALSCLSAYEMKWGSQVKAMRYSAMAQKTAEWILSRQEMDQSKWGWGGFYEDEAKTRQSSLSNARAMHGILAYWEFISVTIEQDQSFYTLLRDRLVAWAEGFFGKMKDKYSGPYFERTSAGVNKYPKRTLEAAELMRDIAMIWVDHGELKYWNWTESTYLWLRGENEVGIDLQQVKNLNGESGGFYVGIEIDGSVDQQSSTLITASCAEAMLYALYIDVPEFQGIHFTTATLLIVTLILIFQRRRHRMKNSKHYNP